jgi:universal stress protein A
MFSLRKILVPTDFSDTADAALLRALDLAEQFGAQVTLVHVYRIPTFGYPDGAMIAQVGVAQDLHVSLTNALKNELEAHAARGVPMSYVLRVGSATDAINDVADELGADMIVVGTHGRVGLAHVLLGSTAEQVLRTATRPVLVVRVPPAPPSRDVRARGESPHVASTH